jgi:hypothetical protein
MLRGIQVAIKLLKVPREEKGEVRRAPQSVPSLKKV